MKAVGERVKAVERSDQGESGVESSEYGGKRGPTKASQMWDRSVNRKGDAVGSAKDGERGDVMR